MNLVRLVFRSASVHNNRYGIHFLLYLRHMSVCLHYFLRVIWVLILTIVSYREILQKMGVNL
jgi:hypothetical protein